MKPSKIYRFEYDLVDNKGYIFEYKCEVSNYFIGINYEFNGEPETTHIYPNEIDMVQWHRDNLTGHDIIYMYTYEQDTYRFLEMAYKNVTKSIEETKGRLAKLAESEVKLVDKMKSLKINYKGDTNGEGY